MTGNPTFSLPQDIGTGSSPSFAGLTVLGHTGVQKAVGGVLTNAVPNTDFLPGTTGTGIQKALSGGLTGATVNSDYLPGTTGTAIQKALSGGLTGAVSGSDYAPATFTGATGVLLKNDLAGGFTGATPNTDFVPPSATRLVLSDGIFVGQDNDLTRVSVPERNQFGATVTSPYNVGDVSWTNASFYTTCDFSVTQPTLAFIAINPVAITASGYAGDLAQLIGGGSTAWHEGSGAITDIKGGPFSAHNRGSGIVQNVMALQAVYCNHGAGSIVNAYGLHVESPSNDGSNTNITNAYGVYIQAQDRGTNKWALYAAGPETSHLGGPIETTSTVIQTANGGLWTHGQASELLTLAAAATTDTSANLLPANAIIEAVVARVVTIIPTAATWSMGDATIPARFAAGVAVAAGTTVTGLTHVDQTGTSGPRQTTAAKIRITPNLTPATATGQIRITVFYRQFTPPTS